MDNTIPTDQSAETKFYTGYRVVVAAIEESYGRPLFERKYDVAGIHSSRNNLFVHLRDAVAFVVRNLPQLKIDEEKEEILIFSSCLAEPSARYIMEALTFTGKDLYDNVVVRRFCPESNGRLISADVNYQL